MLPSTLSSSIRPDRAGPFPLMAFAVALSLLASCGRAGDVGDVGESFSIQNSSPVTLVAGGQAEISITIDCFADSVLFKWIDATNATINAPYSGEGVVVPAVAGVACQPGGTAARVVRFFASDDATTGRRSLRLGATLERRGRTQDQETSDVTIDVVSPASPAFSLAVPQQVTLAPGGTSLDVPVTILRSGYGGAIALSWQPLLLRSGVDPDVLGGVRTGTPVADGATAGSLRIEGPGLASPTPGSNRVLRSLLVRAQGGTTDRAAIVQILTSPTPPPEPADFRATPAVNSIALAWTSATNILTYRLERETVSGIWELVAADLPGSSTDYTDTGRAPDTPYSYRLSATNINGTSPFATLTTRTLPTPPPPGATGWVQLGDIVSGGEVDPQPSLLIDGSGRTVVAYREAVGGDVPRLYVKRLEGGAWTQLGTGPLNASPNVARTPSLAIDGSGTLYVAWSELTNPDQERVYVSRLIGSEWEDASTLPGALNGNGVGAPAVEPSLAIDVNNVPAIAWVRQGAVEVRRLIAGQWQPSLSGAGPATAIGAYDVQLTMDGATPVIVWAQGAGAANALKVSKGFDFVPLGGEVQLPPFYAGTPPIKFFDVVARFGTTYVIYAEQGIGAAGSTLWARQFDGSGWVTYGTYIAQISRETFGAVAVAPDRLVVAYSFLPPAGGPTFVVESATPNGWTELAPFFSDINPSAKFGSLALATPTSPVVTVTIQIGAFYTLGVRRYFPP